MHKPSQHTINKNIRQSCKLRKQQKHYNQIAAYTTLSAIALYIATAGAIEDKKCAWAVALLIFAIAHNAAAIYCLTKSYKKGQAAMNALKHGINTQGK